MAGRYGKGVGFDWPSHIREKNDLKQRSRDRDIARTQRQQDARDKAAELKASSDEILRTSLNGDPVDLARLEQERRRIQGGRVYWRGGWK